MSFQYLSEDQRARYRRFLTDPSPEDLERFFYLDAVALAEVAKKSGPHNRLGWAVQWGTVRMLGTFLADPGDGGAGSKESGTNWGGGSQLAGGLSWPCLARCVGVYPCTPGARSRHRISWRSRRSLPKFVPLSTARGASSPDENPTDMPLSCVDMGTRIAR